ncbi:extracellular solute-binding protein [Nocardioides sp. NPDC087217]|uniref:extracellular solute-binding protein n=1 Tax=Nocardioides sp. NPDC087217 TaxID=3364335 RepID=UPI00381BAC17
MRRTIGAAAATLLAASLLSACAGTSADDSTLVVAGYGAEYKEAFNKVIAEAFTKETGIEIEYQDAGSASQYYAQTRASRGQPGFDIAVGTQVETYQGAEEGMLAPVTEEEVPNIANLPESLRKATHGAGIVQDVQYLALMYNEKTFSRPPTSWNVMWDPRYRSGTIIVNPSNLSGVYQIVLAAQLAGGGVDDIEPGFKRIAELAPHAAGTITSSSEALPYMERGTATAFPYLDGRAGIYAESTNFDYTLPQEGAIGLLGTLQIPSEASNKEAAYELMDFWLRPEIQKQWAEAYHVGPAITGLDFDADFAAKHVTTEERLADLQMLDPQVVIENRTDWSRRWAEAVD